ncbi:conserved hypothetical protein [Oleispira antarctica RB-8]|uniref:Uncharacterized protein n=1 Tax=Oleispira antarctica RB-8 TaxID=698738 RepID=R4YQE7_OLEAN|nr:conserved hypothetical protein [Oleispira antarctica RB-8]
MLNIETLLDGEKALANAPKAVLADGRFCIPQHYLSYQHSLSSVEQLLLDIDFDPRYPIFASQDETGIYVQVGIIGVDNYKSNTNSQEKVVYGRKWRVEPQLPSSEIIQTVFLALKKAREHEIRELFRLEHNNKMTTPFNNHHDLPLLTNSRERLQPTASKAQALFCTEIEKILKTIRYDGMQFELLSFLLRPTGEYLVELKLLPQAGDQLAELTGTEYISFMLAKPTINYFTHQLMQHLIQLSDRYIDEQFRYRGFNRFSWENEVSAIAQLSTEVRQLHKSADLDGFNQHWQQSNYETDRSRIPVVSSGALWSKLKNQLDSFSPIASTLPINNRL